MYRGVFDPGFSYNVGDVVIFDNGERAVYNLQSPAPEGTPPTDSLYWGRVGQPISDCVLLICDAVEQVEGNLETAEINLYAAIESHFADDKTLVLASSTEDSDKKFAITVYDDGEIDAAEIEEETPDEGGES